MHTVSFYDTKPVSCFTRFRRTYISLSFLAYGKLIKRRKESEIYGRGKSWVNCIISKYYIYITHWIYEFNGITLYKKENNQCHYCSSDDSNIHVHTCEIFHIRTDPKTFQQLEITLHHLQHRHHLHICPTSL